jgi:hypothetical protein
MSMISHGLLTQASSVENAAKLLRLVPDDSLEPSTRRRLQPQTASTEKRKSTSSVAFANPPSTGAAASDADDFWDRLPTGTNADPSAAIISTEEFPPGGLSPSPAAPAGPGGAPADSAASGAVPPGRRFSFAPGGLNLRGSVIGAVDLLGPGASGVLLPAEPGLGSAGSAAGWASSQSAKAPAPAAAGPDEAEDEDSSNDRYDYYFDHSAAHGAAGQKKSPGQAISPLSPSSPSHFERNRALSPSNKIKLTKKSKSFDDDEFEIGPQVRGYNRKVLLNSKLQKPLYSIRRVKQLCKWVTSMHIWERPVSIMNLHSEMCSGLLLCRMMKVLVPEAEFLHLNEKALSKKAALENLEKALGVIWRSKCVNNTRIPAAMDIFTGNAKKVAIMLQEIFDVFVQQPLYKVAPKMFAWFDTILKQYDRPLPREIFYEGNMADLWSHFQSGFCLFCIIYHLHGNVMVGEGNSAVRIDSMRVYSNPANIVEFRSNISYVFSLLAALKIEILWDMEDWITFADTEFVVLQLFYVYDKLQHRQCSLPPAQGTSAGVTSGANGEPQVTGMIYADTRPGKLASKKHKTVLLGSGDDSLAGLPIDRTGDADISAHRFYLPPAGLLATNSRSAPSFVETKPVVSTSQRLDWNASATTTSMIESRHETRYVDALRRDKTNHSPDGRNKPASVGAGSTPIAPAGSGLLSNNASLVAAMEELEKAMTEAQKELEDQEDDLAARFLDLESRGAGFIPPAEYKVRFDNLEREAILLAEERVKLQVRIRICEVYVVIL